MRYTPLPPPPRVVQPTQARIAALEALVVEQMTRIARLEALLASLTDDDTPPALPDPVTIPPPPTRDTDGAAATITTTPPRRTIAAGRITPTHVRLKTITADGRVVTQDDDVALWVQRALHGEPILTPGTGGDIRAALNQTTDALFKEMTA